MSTVTPIHDPESYKSHTTSLPANALLVTYFHAPWAAPCAQMSTVLSTLASTYPATSPISFVSVNAEDNPDVAEDFDVAAVPHIILTRGGKVVEEIGGNDAQRVRDTIEKHVSAGSKANGAQLPPKQEVTRPKEQPVPDGASVHGTTATTTTSANGAAGVSAKNLSAYAPSSADAQHPNNGAVAPDGNAANGTSTEEELHSRLSQLTQAAPVMLFMKGSPSAPQCGFSRQLVSLLRERGVRYGFFNILADEEVRQGLKTFADWPTFPQLWMGGELVGGLDIVREEVEGDPGFFKDYSVNPGGLPVEGAA